MIGSTSVLTATTAISSCVRVWSVIDPLSAVNWDVLQPARTSQFMSSLLSSSCSDSGIQYLSVSVYVCVCLNTPMISVLSDWLADGVDLSDSAVCQAG